MREAHYFSMPLFYHSLQIGDSRMHYVDEGQGAETVFVHRLAGAQLRV